MSKQGTAYGVKVMMRIRGLINQTAKKQIPHRLVLFRNLTHNARQTTLEVKEIRLSWLKIRSSFYVEHMLDNLSIHWQSFRVIYQIACKNAAHMLHTPHKSQWQWLHHAARREWYIHCESKKLCHFYFYCNFGKCWSIFKILSMSESERNAS